PYTEAANKITDDIDVCDVAGIFEKLKQCDFEMFEPKGQQQYFFQTLFHDDVIEAISKVANIAADIMTSQTPNAIVISGCGTSGRVAFLTARSLNKIVPGEKFRYTIAGGDKALFTSQEAPEDNRKAGVNDLIKSTIDDVKVLYIGITCGLSAPYVAGQLDYCMDNLDKFVPVIIGFNPVYLARKNPIYDWDKTFYDVVTRLERLTSQRKGFLINPVLGGEAITGSSRMKGGSITMVILQTIFTHALNGVLTSSDMTSQLECKNLLKSYQNTCRLFYESSTTTVTTLMTSATQSLKSNSSVYYVSSGGSGVLGIVDSTECIPTYGASLDDVRGFIVGGYGEFNNAEGDIGSLGKNYQIGCDDLSKLLKLRDLEHNDTILVVAKSWDDPVLNEIQVEKDLGTQLKLVAASQSNVYVVVIDTEQGKREKNMPDYVAKLFVISIDLNEELLSENLIEICSKWIFNAVSTGAHVLIGKVFRNYMVDLKVSNQKLFHRSIGIIQRFCPSVSEQEAMTYLLKSIHDVTNVDDVMHRSIKDHVLRATPKDKVVPTAIVMATTKCDVTQARQLLSKYHVIRDALSSVVTP
uniref:SIS domain-containing protein n=1 Tax=Ciona intestinalis TaxID=7719 RepID=F6Z336_CIOIN